MKINFNHVRVCALQEYNSLVKQLNEIEQVTENSTIVKIMDDLRASLCSIAAAYIDGNPDCICVLDEVESIAQLDDKS